MTAGKTTRIDTPVLSQHFMTLILTGDIFKAMSAAPFPLAVGDVKTDRHRTSDGQVAVGRHPHAKQTLEEETTC